MHTFVIHFWSRVSCCIYIIGKTDDNLVSVTIFFSPVKHFTSVFLSMMGSSPLSAIGGGDGTQRETGEDSKEFRASSLRLPCVRRIDRGSNLIF